MSSPVTFDIGGVLQSVFPVIMIVFVVIILITVFKEVIGVFRTRSTTPRIIK